MKINGDSMGKNKKVRNWYEILISLFLSLLTTVIFWGIEKIVRNQILHTPEHPIENFQFWIYLIVFMISLLIYCVVFQYKFRKIQHHYIKSYRTFLKYYKSCDHIKEHIVRELNNNDFISSVGFSCPLKQYQQILKDIIEDDKINKIYFTNIYRPKELLENEVGHRQSLVDKENAEKIDIHILNGNNIEKWRIDHKNGLVEQLMEQSRIGNIKTKFVVEKGIRFDIKENLRPGDYALFNDEMLVSYFPVTEDELDGQLWLSFGDSICLDSFPNIFLDKIRNHYTTIFYNSFKDANNNF